MISGYFVFSCETCMYFVSFRVCCIPDFVPLWVSLHFASSFGFCSMRNFCGSVSLLQLLIFRPLSSTRSPLSASVRAYALDLCSTAVSYFNDDL